MDFVHVNGVFTIASLSIWPIFANYLFSRSIIKYCLSGNSRDNRTNKKEDWKALLINNSILYLQYKYQFKDQLMIIKDQLVIFCKISKLCSISKKSVGNFKENVLLKCRKETYIICFSYIIEFFYLNEYISDLGAVIWGELARLDGGGSPRWDDFYPTFIWNFPSHFSQNVCYVAVNSLRGFKFLSIFKNKKQTWEKLVQSCRTNAVILFN